MEIDVSLEKIVFIFNADEGNYGIYDLVWELGKYKELDIGEKYSIAKQLIINIIKEGLGSIKTYRDAQFKEKANEIGLEDLNEFLDNPGNWNPNSMPLPCLEITKEGRSFLEEQMLKRKEELSVRLFNGSFT
jgi:hypothetical protein